MEQKLKKSSHIAVQKTVLSAFFLAIAIVMPFLTGQIPKIGAALCPMHIPVLLCGYFCGPLYACIMGFTAPLLRFALFGMPPIIPSGIGMCFELAAYGIVAGVLYRIFPLKKIYIYISLICAMLTGRIVWGAVRVLLFRLGKYEFGWEAFLAGAFTNAVPGIILQIILVPVLVMTINKAFSGFAKKHDIDFF